MSETTTKFTDDNSTLTERFLHGVSLVDSSPVEAVAILEELQKHVAALGLFSSNETVEDISTKSLPLLALEFHLAAANMGCPTTKSSDRKTRVMQSIDLYSAFLLRMEQLELLSKEQIKDYHDLLEMASEEFTSSTGAGNSTRTSGQQREAKIARFRAKQQAQKELERLKSLQQRRGRLQTLAQEEMDGFDQESLERRVAIQALNLYASESLDEWFQAQRELPMIDMAIRMEEQRSAEDRYRGVASNTSVDQDDDRRRPLSGQPLQVTHITQDAVTGQLKMKKEEIRSKVFQPGWNQPTMSLQELGEMERKQAMQREERQRAAEAEQKNGPRRYDHLVRDGMEDDADLVDASAQLDRDWDDFKDENPRGCGNKMGDRGDRNF